MGMSLEFRYVSKQSTLQIKIKAHKWKHKIEQTITMYYHRVETIEKRIFNSFSMFSNFQIAS